MDPDAMKRFIDYLLERQRESDLNDRAKTMAMERMAANIDELTASNRESSEKMNRILEQMNAMASELRGTKAELKKANREILKYKELYNRAMQELYGSRQKNNPS